MNVIEKEICNELISHANTKKEVLKAMLVSFPAGNKTAYTEYVDKQWYEKPLKGHFTLCKLSYKEKKNLLESLLIKKEAGRVKKIYLHLTKHVNRQFPKEMYENIIGKNNMQEKGRESYRGKEVELISFSPDGGRIIIEDKEWKSRLYYFTIYDINCTYDVITE